MSQTLLQVFEWFLPEVDLGAPQLGFEEGTALSLLKATDKRPLSDNLDLAERLR